MNRPMAPVAVALACGVAFAALRLPGASWLFAASAAAGGAAAWITSRSTASRLPAVLLLFFAAGGLLWQARHDGPPGDPLSRYLAASRPGRSALEGLVRTADLSLPSDDYTPVIVDVEQMRTGPETVEVRGGMLIRWTQPTRRLLPGDRVRVVGEPSLSIGRVNPGLSGAEDHYRRRGVHTAIRARGGDVERVASALAWYLPAWAARWRAAQADRLLAALPETTQPFVLAVWLGDRGSLSQAENQAYIDAGVAHVLAVSGIHVGLIFSSLSFVLPLSMRSERSRAVICLVCITAFCFLAGARPSTVRATLMVAICLGADLVRRERDAVNALATAAVVMLVWAPGALLDLGFQLSYLSVASLMLTEERIRTRLPALPLHLREGLSATLGAQVLPLPVALHAFHVLPLAGPVVNLVVVPLLAVALWLCMLTTAAGWVWTPLAELFGHALLPVVATIRGLAEHISAAPATRLLLPSPTPWAACAYWAGVLLLAAAFARPAGNRRLAWYGAGALLVARSPGRLGTVHPRSSSLT